MHIEWKWTVPNLLSMLRLALIPVFIVLYGVGGGRPPLLYWALAVLVLSGVTDLLDGWIARRFNQISDLGKLLDPLADKLTQFSVLVCLTATFHQLLPLVAICFGKELLQGIGGLLLLWRGEKIRGSLWYGKVSTFTFYLVMAIFMLFELLDRPVPNWLSILLVVLVGVTMLFAFFNYLRVFVSANKSLKENDAPDAEPLPDGSEENAPHT